MKKIVGVIGVFWVILGLVSFASAVSVEAEKVSDVVIPDLNHPAEFDLKISGAVAGNYNIYTLTDVSLRPTGTFFVSGSAVKRVEVYPTNELDVRGFYTFTYFLNDELNSNFENQLTVKVADLDEVIEISSDTIEYGSDKVVFYVQNTESTTLYGLKGSFSSILFDDVEVEFDLGPLEKYEIEVDVDSDKLNSIRAGSYVVTGVFESDSGDIDVSGKIYIGEKKGVKTEDDASGIFLRTRTISKISTGNVPEIVEVVIEKDIISRLFTSFNVEPVAVDRKGLVVKYTWNEGLGPSEVFTVKAKTNYFFPFLIIVAGILIVLGFRRYTETKVEVKKSVSHIKTKGGEFALKVKLNVKARKNVENVSLIDRVPGIVKVYEKFGTTKPDKIDAANRRIHWNIGDLNVGEERVFSYVVYSKVGVVGKFSLPAALAVFEKDGEIQEVDSNSVFFLSEQARSD